MVAFIERLTKACRNARWVFALIIAGGCIFCSPLPLAADPRINQDNAAASPASPLQSAVVTAATASLVSDLDSVAFGQVVAQIDNFRLVPAWQKLLLRADAEDALCRRQCGSKAWQHLIADLRRLPPAAQIMAVQHHLNQVPYRDDMANWHLIDYWATPSEFLRKGGDCEDYAIAKYFALRAAGWAPADLRVMLSHRQGEFVGHAYLIARDHGDWLVLDNRAAQPYRPTASIDGLWAGYSLNEENLWIHRNAAAPNFIVSSKQ